MAKKQMQLKKSIPTKNNEETPARINFEVSVALRNAFKAKVASQGKLVKDVFADFMKQYIEKP